ncbi:MAG: mycothiol transferase, partial [Intrasporangium sp.]|uniref:mycothiol transferase n=1 Tax=Intrasporangium sp. TaxID=1925024 RepID=UPI003F8065FD
DFNGAQPDSALVEDAFATWKAEIAKADEWLDAHADADLSEHVSVHDETASVRDILVHVIEEYARHAGHADLLRECIDGRTGQ